MPDTTSDVPFKWRVMLTLKPRVASAVRELARKDEPLTQERVMEYLMQRDGRGCSERDAHQVLSEYRKVQEPHMRKVMRDIRAAIARHMRSLDADTRHRVARELSQVGRSTPEWMEWVRPSSRRRA